jgi:hypothetical protein
VPGAVAQELQLPPVRESGGAPGAIKIHLKCIQRKYDLINSKKNGKPFRY